jgi:hypothetical protein
MAITTYAELKTAVADFLNRDDLTSQIPTFISLAEADINRKLRHWNMEKRSVAEINSQYSAVPSDWIETIRFRLTDGTTYALDFMSQAEIIDYRAGIANVSGRPAYYAVSGGQFEFAPTPGDTYNAELLYYAKIAALSDSNTSNWLLLDAPDIYLYGALVHSAPYLAEDARAAVWAGLYQSALDGLNATSDAARHSGAGLKLKIRAYR